MLLKKVISGFNEPLKQFQYSASIRSAHLQDMDEKREVKMAAAGRWDILKCLSDV